MRPRLCRHLALHLGVYWSSPPHSLPRLSRVVYTTLAAITDKHQKLMDDDLQQVRVRVRTAVPLTGQAREDLTAKPRHVLGDRLVLLAEIGDRTMLGGFIVESGNLVLNASLDAQLERIRRRVGREEARAASAMRC